MPYGEALKNQVTHRWGNVCGVAAPPARLLWTFDGCPVGPSPVGWSLTGIPWPDPPGVLRTTPVAAQVEVREPWRIDPVADRMQGTQPAVVIGDAVPCYDGRPGPADQPLKHWRAGQPLTFSNRALPRDGAVYAEVAAHLAAGVPLRDVLAAHQETAWDPEIGDPRRHAKFDCEGRILRSPERDEAEPAPFGSPLDRDRVKQAWNETGFVPDRLADAVSIDAGADAFTAFTALLLVPERAFGGDIVLSLRDADGGELGEERVTVRPLRRRRQPPAGRMGRPGGPVGRSGAARRTHRRPCRRNLRPGPLPGAHRVPGPAATASPASSSAGIAAPAQGADFPAFYVVAADGTSP